MALCKVLHGRYRAYRKVNNVEYQIYCDTKEEGNIAQAKLDKRVAPLIALTPKVLFGKEGNLLGYRVRLIQRPLRPARIIIYKQIQLQFEKVSREFVYKDDFESLWREVYNDWKLHWELLPQDVNCLRKQIKLAKQHYIAQIAECEQARKFA